MKSTPHFASDVAPENRDAQLLADVAKLPEMIKDLKAGRGLSMRIPADGDDWDLLLTRIIALTPLVIDAHTQRHSF